MALVKDDNNIVKADGEGTPEKVQNIFKDSNNKDTDEEDFETVLDA